MEWSTFWQIAIASIGFGAGGEGIRRYRKFKQRRRETSRSVRNAGFWTDSRIALAEIAFCAAALAIPFSVIVVFAFDGYSIEGAYVALLAYAGAIMLILRGMNLTDPQ